MDTTELNATLNALPDDLAKVLLGDVFRALYDDKGQRMLKPNIKALDVAVSRALYEAGAVVRELAEKVAAVPA